jgi:hypothetical protein
VSVLVNLLPDVRQAKLREHRRRQLVSGVSILVWIVSGSVVALLTLYTVGQKAVIYTTTNDIQKNETNLKNISQLPAALTASAQAAALPSLYSQRTFMSKFFAVYEQASPTDITLNAMTTDNQNNLTISGSGPSYAEIAKLARALAASNVNVGTGAATGNTPYFNTVNITSVSETGNQVDFTITGVIDPSAESEVGSGGQ